MNQYRTFSVVHVCVVCLSEHSNLDYDQVMTHYNNGRATCTNCGMLAGGAEVTAYVCTEDACGRLWGTCPHTGQRLNSNWHLELPIP